MNPEREKHPPSIETLNAFIQNEMFDVVEELIRKHNLKIRIEGGKLVDISNTTDAWLRRFITVSPPMLLVKDMVRKLSAIDDEVLITGETGTGKEIIARALHGDRDGRFIAVNCAGIPEPLLESTLFGYIKGAFTGANKDRNGLMTLATNGTLFLDEIGELPLELQAKLLRAIQEKVITKVGGDIEEKISCRIVAATNKNLQELCRVSKFRVDLLARISTFELNLIPLRVRKEDIEPILKSLPNGEDFVQDWYLKKPNQNLEEYINTQFNVRSLQSIVRRWKILGNI